MKKYLSIVIALMIATLAFADIYTIETAYATQANVPTNGYAAYSWSRALYTASELGNAGVPAGPIDAIGFNVASSPVNFKQGPMIVYIRETDATTLDTTYPDKTEYQEVFNNPYVWNGSGWHHFVFSNSFEWDGESNIEFLFENHNGFAQDEYLRFYSQANSYRQMATHKYANDAFPDTDGSSSADRPDIRIITPMSIPPDATTPVNPANGETFVDEFATLNWYRTVGATGYKLYFGATNPPAYFGDLGNAATYDPGGMVGNYTYFWQIIPYNDAGEADDCPIWSFTITPAGTVVIGDGNAFHYMPVNTQYNYSYSQSIYLREDIEISNQRIEKISYYWNGVGAAPNSNQWDIYMGHTDNDTFINWNDWLPIDQLTQVYSGTLDIPATEGWITINLSNPFAYNNTQNLVIAVNETKPGYDNYRYFFYNTNTLGENRSIRVRSDNHPITLAHPSSGTLTEAFPNIIMEFGNIPGNPIFNHTPAFLDFGTQGQDIPSPWKNVTITNTGGGFLNLSESNISIVGINATMFEIDTESLPVDIGPGSTFDLPVRAKAMEEGPISAILRMVYNGVYYYTELAVEGLPAETLFIGDGPGSIRFPFGHYFGFERAAALYTAEQVGSTGTITNVGWYCTSPSGGAIPYKIYVGTTENSAFTEQKWDDFKEDLTLVNEGTYQFNIDGWHSFPFIEPYYYGGGNLIVAVESNYGGVGFSPYDYFRCSLNLSNPECFAQWASDDEPPTDDNLINPFLPDLILYKEDDPPPPSLSPITDLRLYQSGTDVILEWTPVENAEWYGAYISLDPYTDFILVDILETANSITIPMDELNLDRIFIRITAGAGEPPIPVD